MLVSDSGGRENTLHIGWYEGAQFAFKFRGFDAGKRLT